VSKLELYAHGDLDYEEIHRGNADKSEDRLSRDVQMNRYTSSYFRVEDLSLSRGIDQDA